MHTHECENCHKTYEHAVIETSKHGTPCTEVRNGFCSASCEEAYPKRGTITLEALQEAFAATLEPQDGSTYHPLNCGCGFCKAGFTKA